MALTYDLPIPQNIKNPGASFANADGTAWKTIASGGANGALVKTASATSTDTVDQIVQLGISDGTTVRPIGCVPVPASAGNNGAQHAVDLFDAALLPQLALDSNGKAYLGLQAGYFLQAKVLVAVTAAKQIDAACHTEEY